MDSSPNADIGEKGIESKKLCGRPLCMVHCAAWDEWRVKLIDRWKIGDHFFGGVGKKIRARAQLDD